MTPQPIPSSPTKVCISTLMRSERYQVLLAERQELVRQAKPLFAETLCTDPFYKARENDALFWSSFVGSGVTAARNLLAASKAVSTKA